MNRPLLILDIDETLIYGTQLPLDYASDFTVGPFLVHKRPHLDLFLKSVLEWYDCAIWSSATADYVCEIVKHVFPDVSALRFVWGSERCTPRSNPETGEMFWLKNLQKVERRGFDLARTVMVDDSPEKLQQHYGNHLRIEPFLGSKSDQELLLILPVLKWLRDMENVRAVEKRDWRIRFSQKQL